MLVCNKYTNAHLQKDAGQLNKSANRSHILQ